MRFTRLVKAIECGTPIEKNRTPSQGGLEKIMEASKKRKKTMVESDDSAMNQSNLLETDQTALMAGNTTDNSDGGNIALGGKTDDILAARKFTKPRPKKAAIGKSKIGVNDLASSGVHSSNPVESEPEPHSPKVGTQVSCFGVTKSK